MKLNSSHNWNIENGIVQGHLSTLFFHLCYVMYLIFRRAVSSFAGQKSLTPPKVGMLFAPLHGCSTE